MGLVSVAWLKSAIRVSACRRRPKKKGEFAASAICGAEMTWAAFQWSANSPGPTCRCSWTDVHADSGAMESAKDADGDDPRVGLLRLGLGPVERLAQALLELQGGVPRQGPRCDVELDVELRELGLVLGVGDGLEHLVVDEGGLLVLVDEVELDLQAGQRDLVVEGPLGEHPLEDIEVLADLFAVALALFAGVALRGDVLAHGPCLSPVMLLPVNLPTTAPDGEDPTTG